MFGSFEPEIRDVRVTAPNHDAEPVCQSMGRQMISLPYHVHIHARGRQVLDASTIRIGRCQITTLGVGPADLGLAFPITFDDAVASLEKIPRMFIEPDGSFVWPADDWQIDGNLFDGGSRLHYVEVKGNCVGTPLETFLRAFGNDQTPLMFQLVREAVFVGEDEFRRLVAGTR